MLRRSAFLGILFGCAVAVPAQGADVKLDKIKLGESILGPKWSADEFKGKVVLIEAWGLNCPIRMRSMPHLVKWNNELNEYGLVIVGAHFQNVPDLQVRAKLTSLGVTFSIVKGAFDLPLTGIPHCHIFDTTGNCVFDGSPLDPKAEKELRSAVGKALCNGIDKPTKTMATLVDALGKGQSPPLVLPRVVGLLKSLDKDTAAQAQQVVDNFTAGARKNVEEADRVKEADPVGAYDLVEKVPSTYKGTPVAATATEMITSLKKEKAVQAELKARPSLEAIRKIDTYLTQAAEKFKITDLKDPKFLKSNASSIDQLKRSLQGMQKTYPEAKATEQAAAIGEKYGVTVK